MAKKGYEKNVNNRDKHNKLISQKINKKKTKEANRKARLKAIIDFANAGKSELTINSNKK